MTVNDKFGFFSPGGTWVDGHVAWNAFGSEQIVGMVFCFSMLLSLFVFRKWYQFLVNHKWITISVGIAYLGLYVAYYAICVTYFYTEVPNVVANWQGYNIFKNNITDLRPKVSYPSDFAYAPFPPPQNIMPLHWSSAAELCAAMLLITRSKRLFNYTFPLIALLPLAAILSPDKVFYGFNNYFYYDFYLNHTLMILVYWWFYLYGIKQYNPYNIRFSFICGIGLAIAAVLYDWIFNTNLLYVGKQGYNFTTNISTSNLIVKTISPIQSFILIVAFGTVCIVISYLLISLKKPLYRYYPHSKFFSKKEVLHDRKVFYDALLKMYVWDDYFLHVKLKYYA